MEASTLRVRLQHHKDRKGIFVGFALVVGCTPWGFFHDSPPGNDHISPEKGTFESMIFRTSRCVGYDR